MEEDIYCASLETSECLKVWSFQVHQSLHYPVQGRARIMIGRMKSMLPKLIYSEQDAFVGDRSISDNVIVV